MAAEIPTPWSLVEDEVAAEVEADQFVDPDTLTITSRGPLRTLSGAEQIAMSSREEQMLELVANDEAVRVRIHRSPFERSWELRVMSDAETTHTIAEHALTDVRTPINVMRDGIRAAASKHREHVLDGLLSRMPHDQVAALLVGRLVQHDGGADQALVETTAIELMRHVDSIR